MQTEIYEVWAEQTGNGSYGGSVEIPSLNLTEEGEKTLILKAALDEWLDAFEKQLSTMSEETREDVSINREKQEIHLDGGWDGWKICWQKHSPKKPKVLQKISYNDDGSLFNELSSRACGYDDTALSIY